MTNCHFTRAKYLRALLTMLYQCLPKKIIYKSRTVQDSAHYAIIYINIFFNVANNWW